MLCAALLPLRALYSMVCHLLLVQFQYYVEPHLQNHMRIAYTHAHTSKMMYFNLRHVLIHHYKPATEHSSHIGMSMGASANASPSVRLYESAKRLWSFANEHPLFVIRIVYVTFSFETRANEKRKHTSTRSLTLSCVCDHFDM